MRRSAKSGDGRGGHGDSKYGEVGQVARASALGPGNQDPRGDDRKIPVRILK